MDSHEIETHELTPDQPVQLNQVPSDGRIFHEDRDSAEFEFRNLRDELVLLQRRLYAEGKHKLLVVFQAMDAGGKDGTIRRVFRGVNPQGVLVTSFKVPSKRELAYDFLWRVHMAVPSTGMIGVFNRSHYEDVLVVRVHNIVPKSVWRPRYNQINIFEQLLVESGTTILKFYLHISREEQRDRFQDRINDPEKNWKFSLADLEKREYWNDYMKAYEELLSKTTSQWSPWYIIPANQKWYRNLAVTKVIVAALRRLDPQFPTSEEKLKGIIIN